MTKGFSRKIRQGFEIHYFLAENAASLRFTTACDKQLKAGRQCNMKQFGSYPSFPSRDRKSADHRPRSQERKCEQSVELRIKVMSANDRMIILSRRLFTAHVSGRAMLTACGAK